MYKLGKHSYFLKQPMKKSLYQKQTHSLPTATLISQFAIKRGRRSIVDSDQFHGYARFQLLVPKAALIQVSTENGP